MPWPQRYVRFGRWLAITAIIVGLALTLFVLSRQSWVMSDGLVYQEAAERLRNGEPLFTGVDESGRSYRYAPWFAFAWMMLRIPDALWIGAMTTCAVVAVIPAFRSGLLGVALGSLVFPYLLVSAMGGHVQPALIAGLAYCVGTRAGPVAIAVAASLKVIPALYVLVFLARRQWAEAAVTLALTAVLVAPMLLFDLSRFPVVTEGSWGLYEWSVALWFIGCVGLTAFLVWRPSWSAGSLLVTLAIPKFVYYDVGYLLVGRHRRALRSRPTSREAPALPTVERERGWIAAIPVFRSRTAIEVGGPLDAVARPALGPSERVTPGL